MKICPVGGELFPADGQIDMAKLIVSFRNIWNASKILRNACVCVCVYCMGLRTNSDYFPVH